MIPQIILLYPSTSSDTYAYNNPTIVQGEELNRRGFQMQGTGSTAPSSLNREPPQPALPRIGQNYNQGATDFSAALNNNDLVFGGDRPSNLNQRNKNQPQQQPVRGSVAPMDYNYRTPMGMSNDNFSLPNPGQESGSGPGPSNYLNERMQY